MRISTSLSIVLLVSSLFFAAFSAQAQNDVKFQILHLQEEIEQNKENPNYDLKTAQNELNELKSTYKPEARSDNSDEQASSAVDYNPGNQVPPTREAYIAKHKDFIEEVKRERNVALKNGMPTDKYDKRIQEYEDNLRAIDEYYSK